MRAIIQGAGVSELGWEAQRLVICLPRQVSGAMWETLVARLTEVWQSRAYIAWTQPAMTVSGNGPDAPRWKVHPLDVLRGLLFLLRVLANHESIASPSTKERGTDWHDGSDTGEGGLYSLGLSEQSEKEGVAGYD
jgi:hypothetical protein